MTALSGPKRGLLSTRTQPFEIAQGGIQTGFIAFSKRFPHLRLWVQHQNLVPIPRKRAEISGFAQQPIHLAAQGSRAGGAFERQRFARIRLGFGQRRDPGFKAFELRIDGHGSGDWPALRAKLSSGPRKVFQGRDFFLGRVEGRDARLPKLAKNGVDGRLDLAAQSG